MRYPHILAALRSARWAVTPSTLQAIRDVLSSRLVMDRASRPAARADEDAPVSPLRPAPVLGAKRIGLVPVFGIIGKRLSELETMCGGCDLDQVSAALSQAVADPANVAVILHLDSPGGTVTGVPELAAKIRELTKQKPIYAFTDGLCCSAAYWLAASCTGIFCTTSADLGSIGVYMALVDESAAWAQEGYRMVLIKAGEQKADGIAGLPITEEQVTRWQTEIDEVYRLFTTDVRSGRGSIEDSTMQGQTFMGEAAVKVNLADSLVTDLETLAAQIVE